MIPILPAYVFQMQERSQVASYSGPNIYHFFRTLFPKTMSNNLYHEKL